MTEILVAAAGPTIVAFNPENRQRLMLRPRRAKTPVLDMIANNGNPFHAELHVKTVENRRADDRIETHLFPYALIVNSLNGKTANTVWLPAANTIGQEKLYRIPRFSFTYDGQHIGYESQEGCGTLWPTADANVTRPMTGEGDIVRYRGRAIGTLEQDVSSVVIVDAHDFKRAMRKKNPSRYDRNRGFFQ